MDEFYKPDLSPKEESQLEKLQSQVENCIYCQPYDDGEPFWILGEKTELEDLLSDLKIPEKSWDKINQHLHCPYCGNESFDRYSDVGIKTRFDKEVEKHLDEVEKLYGKEVKKFEEYLEKNPFLAYSQRFAKRIYKEIKNKELPVTRIKGKFFRARKVSGAEVLNIEGMYNPPIGKPQEGRFNHAGQSHLYLSNDKNTAIKEVVTNENSLLVWCQEFEIKKEIENVLDLTFDWNKLTPSTSTLLLSITLNNSISRSDRNKELWRPDYFLTRYIMDCAKELGYEGIKYDSTKNISEYNLVLFHRDKIQIEPIGKPKIEIFMNRDEKNEFESNILDI